MKRGIIMLLAACLLCALAMTAGAEALEGEALDAFLEEIGSLRPAYDYEGARSTYGMTQGETGMYNVKIWLDESGEDQTFCLPWATTWSSSVELEPRTQHYAVTQYNTAKVFMDMTGMNMINQAVATQYISSGADISEMAIITGAWNDRYAVGLFSFKDQQGELIGDELYAYFSYDAQEDGTYARTTELIVDQAAVLAITQRLIDAGMLSIVDLVDWAQRRGGDAVTPAQQPQEEAAPAAEPAAGQSDAAQRMVRITGNGNVNVRAKSNADSAKVGTAKEGNTYPCVSVAKNGWYEIALEDGTTGFVSPKLAEMVE